ncbi:MAG: ATP synthase F1 subunit gamma [Lachnospiraceae bacterium]|nr:ATP synthase F1 subunit gamma [Bacillota bacterium]MBR6477448.1 ATP synthase F1 subunit gamma [Lachnospiraceae bacterium]
MASMRDIKRRRSSIQSTQQITKAMKLVSTVKLQRARAGAERSKSYFNCMFETMNSILARVGYVDHKYLRSGETGKKAVILITSNRGLAGGYNNNVAKLVTRHETWKKEDLLIYSIGNKGREILSRAGYEIKEALPDVMEDPTYADAMFLTERLLMAFEEGEISEIYLAYTSFKNTVSHIPTLMKLLPVDRPEPQDLDGDGKPDEVFEGGAPMNFEPEDEEALDLIIPKYVSSLIYGGLVEALASENGARMQAMDNATNNAAELIDDLELLYNRARQGSITQELTEIIAGANAIQ